MKASYSANYGSGKHVRRSLKGHGPVSLYIKPPISTNYLTISLHRQSVRGKGYSWLKGRGSIAVGLPSAVETVLQYYAPETPRNYLLYL